MKSVFSKLYYKIIGDLSVYYQVYGNYKKAGELCEASVKNGGNSVNALNLYGIIKLQEGNASEALECLTRARQLNKNPVMEKRLAVSIGSCHWLAGNIDEGIQTIEALIGKYDYLNSDVYTTLGFLYLLKNDYENALKYTNEAISVTENHAPAYDNLGQIYFIKAEYDKAEASFKKALKLNPGMTDSKYYLGLIYEKHGDLTKAKNYFESAGGDYINALNTITKEQIEEKRKQYSKITFNR